jgi:hypothetical protein
MDDMEFLHTPLLDAFMEWHSGVLVRPSGAARLPENRKHEAVRLFAPPIFFNYQPPEEAADE